MKGSSVPVAATADAAQVRAARDAGLRYVSDLMPGISRKSAGRSFRYVDPHGKVIRNRDILNRIQRLVIPPAWKDVWICPTENGHIQAVGRDARHRKQYIYHPQWRATRDQAKYTQMLAFAKALPTIRRRVRRDLGLAELSREKLLATVVNLLELTLIRVGNEEYARTNHSFGLTTMRRRHVDVSKSTIRFEFRGKSGVEHEIDIQDQRLAKVIRECQELPGQRLFQYVDEAGERHEVNSDDVNQYLQEITGADFTAKDFRTWAGTALAARALQAVEEFDSETAAKRNITEAIRDVAQRLGNTMAVCRKCYVHPAILDAYLDHSLQASLGMSVSTSRRPTISLSGEEKAIVKLLRLHQRRTNASKGLRRPSPRRAQGR